MVPENWSATTLGAITKESAFGPRFSSDLYSVDGNVGTIRTTDLDDEGNINYDTIPYARLPSGFESHYLDDGDLLITRSGSCGIPCIFESQDKPIVAGAFLIRFVLKENTDVKYVHALLKSDKLQRKIQNLASGGVQKNLSGTNLKKLEFVLPPLPEQKKIAQILSTWDQAITATERLLENSQQRKKGLMQQLLTGKRRLVRSNTTLTTKKTRTGELPGDWAYPKIAQICHQVTDKNIDDQQYPVLACSKHYGFVDSLKYFKKRVYSKDLTGYRVIPRGCIGFPANHVEEGSIGLQNLYDYGLVSPIYVVARPDSQKVNVDYLYAVLKTDHYRQIFSAATNASVDRRGSLRWKEFSQIHVPLPPLPEQNQIAEVLKLATKEIASLETALDLLKQEKKALMQQLLTGKRRVNVETEAA
ncbi:restriction endonuclease subunit S [Marinobacter xestospongiae]|uniref:Restriction endonuclease subunit S n=1 Tax=Marinobacter xestospongiae TaxID=994319 RepID=A0ABU3W1F5_9GAMM|nr:restriction endonuclease subunit S [Marinobacter xestospongiae]MDV2080369.1 restriction endonuclease subunit S [Marinobacter xestospongiae]